MAHISDDAPEVVHQPSELYSAHDSPSFNSRNSMSQKELANPASELDSRSLSKTPAHDSASLLKGNKASDPVFDHLAPYEALAARDNKAFEDEGNFGERESRGKRKRACPLWLTILLAVGAFIVGAAIAGGVAGSIAVKNKNNSSATKTTSNSPASTPTAGASTATTTLGTIVDAANCPLSNLTTYVSNTSSLTFTINCGNDIYPIDGAFIDVANEITTSFDACMNYCASFEADSNNTSIGGCKAATWVIFDPDNSGRNERCYLKNETGTVVSETESGQTLVSAFLKSS